MGSERPRLCPITLRWLADEDAQRADYWLDVAYSSAGREGEANAMRWHRLHKRRAARLRSLATREEKRRG